MLKKNQKLTQLVNLGLEITRIKDLDLLLEKVLLEARRFFNADAGSIYIVEDGKLHFKHTQNDTLQKQLSPGKKLVYSTFVIPVSNKTIAGYVANTGEILNIGDVYAIPDALPYSFGKEYDDLSRYRTKSMLTCPLKTHRGEVIGILQLINARDKRGKNAPFSAGDEKLVMHFANNAAIAIERAQMTRAMILRMISMAELRDPKETGAHVNRVAAYSVEIYEIWATRMGIAGEEINKNKDILRMAAMLHDVGKVAISDSILKKPGRLSPDEIEIMKQHTFLGARLFSHRYSDFDEAAFQVVLNHHEHWSGNGYPGHIDPLTAKPECGFETDGGNAVGKKGEEIPVFGRVVAIADVYDALSSRRAYKQAWDESAVLENLRSESGRQFDPDVVDAFFSGLDMIRAIAARYPDE